ncbi:MAG TPA: CHASE3 domain-containing protein [Frateuria sp.]|uniref:CHASE3 domain-containing protein n=1 Tax=Frateuria sp. TaxID=2211372 RepID=UPI002D8006B7|nr:CHASE3 domain-containing protein [Frateuria sp.]HET6806818.1 CHASE3 domain-containing protein [Frateuria sp.]
MAVEQPPSLIRSRIMLATGFVLLALLLAGAFVLAGVRERGVEQQQRIQAVRGSLRQTLLTVQGAETGQRGYLLTGQKAYLEPYNRARGELEQILRTLDGQVTDPRLRLRLPELRALIEGKQSELAQTLAYYDRGDRGTAVQLVRSNLGMRLMERIRVLVSSMLADCDRSIAAERSKERMLSRWVLSGASASALAILGLAGLTLREMSRRHRLIVRTRDQLLASSEALRRSTERQAMLEEAIRQSRKMEALGALTGGMAHDFNNMLAVVMGNLELLKGRLARGNHDVGRYVDYALDGTRRAGELTQRLLAFARKQPLNAVLVAPGEVVAGITEVIRRTLGGIYSIELMQAPDLWMTTVDVNQLESALINLAVNARDAMPEGGRLTLQTANVFLDEDYASSRPDVASGPYVMIAMTDTGQGMTAEVRRKAFEPFFTTKAAGKGTGLGLSQVYGFIKQSGGQVEIDSEEGRGTTVRIYLPRADGELAPGPAGADPAAADSLPRGHGTILLVDDDNGVRVFAAEALSELGYRVLTAAGGHDGLAVLDAHPQVDLLLTDVEMAHITGWELADIARQLRPGLKVLLMTGYTRDANARFGERIPGAGLLRKPFTLEELAHRVHGLLADGPGRSPAVGTAG